MKKEAPSLPWWKYGHVWLVISGPVVVVIAGITTLVLAVRTPDPLVAEDYYRKGIEINKTIAAYGALKADPLPLSQIAADRKKAAALVDKVGFDN